MANNGGKKNKILMFILLQTVLHIEYQAILNFKKNNDI